MTTTMKLIFILIEVLITVLVFYFAMKQETKMKKKYILGSIMLTMAFVISYFLLFQ
jgi:putative effector of murein hydrolase